MRGCLVRILHQCLQEPPPHRPTGIHVRWFDGTTVPDVISDALERIERSFGHRQFKKETYDVPLVTLRNQVKVRADELIC